MGWTVGRGALMGLYVGMIGPIELPETSHRLTDPRHDPAGLRYVWTSFGIRIG